ncbi:GNAT family N-acetyltransferase [Kitasatospora sp. NPDC001540]|uniref:GNAT family N-acetyltransferase n=1 Tax=Kitasatospora sp. NPDC001540 TaxID=3364014 RepID=UPI00369D36BA
MPSTDYAVRLASSEDIPALMALRTEAERWLASMGVDQWSDPDLGDRAMQSWLERINRGQTWVFTDEHDAVAATVSRGLADTDFWKESDDPSSALYVYKLIVARSAAGQKLGARILDWLSVIAAAEGKQFVRLDVWRNNRGLQLYYTKQGFEHVRTEHAATRLSGWLGQRPAGTVLFPERMLPTIVSPLPEQFGVDVTEAHHTVGSLADEVAGLQAQLQRTSVPVTGLVRGEYDKAVENLYLAHGSLKRALKQLAEAKACIQALPDPTDLAWAAAPRRA